MTDISNINNTAREILAKIDEAWPDPIVLRKDIAKFSCGLVTTKTMGTLDCEGHGIPNILINGKIAYTKKDVINWLASRISKQESAKKIRGAPRRGKNDVLLQR
ncbi:hypothetical protein FACS189472_08550 [Alphaproteobacteria bacterium]|nr:hypothetical protein FACS189472_08550 [Alphaproteobacteria bacterium]